MNKKDKRRDGVYTPKIVDKGRKKDLFEEGSEPAEEFDEWKTQRDGMHYNPDRTMKRNPHYLMNDKEQIKKDNKKISKQTLIRKARK